MKPWDIGNNSITGGIMKDNREIMEE